MDEDWSITIILPHRPSSKLQRLVRPMTNMMRVLKCLRHPYLLKRAIVHPIERWKTTRHRARLQEYERYERSFPNGIVDLINMDTCEIVEMVHELEGSPFLQHMRERVHQLDAMGALDIESGLVLYVLIRAGTPDLVVETGVARGISSSFILKALEHNNSGNLFSIDLHYREGVAVAHEKALGWAIPTRLKSRWHLTLGESTHILPHLLRCLGPIHLFFHDSRHTYPHMMREYRIAYPHLRKGGFLLSDDVSSNDAFLDFADAVNQEPIIINHLGILGKR